MNTQQLTKAVEELRADLAAIREDTAKIDRIDAALTALVQEVSRDAEAMEQAARDRDSRLDSLDARFEGMTTQLATKVLERADDKASAPVAIRVRDTVGNHHVIPLTSIMTVTGTESRVTITMNDGQSAQVNLPIEKFGMWFGAVNMHAAVPAE